ncbi:hypothetical protein WMY93_015042 [Mugilogobius chulae]|uniref:DRBM domain-containing protein n=1 Tax=Mugilogobius chulae TaxID=88201 RepID=A0AAW0P0Y8_9GOBI
MKRWSQNPTLTQTLFELAEQDDLQVRASSISVFMVWLQVGNEEVVAQGATRKEASVKAMSLALERLKKQSKGAVLEETDKNEAGKQLQEETVREQGEEKLPEEKQARSVSEEENSCPGPSADFGSEEETSADSVMRSFARIFVNLFYKEHTVCDVVEERVLRTDITSDVTDSNERDSQSLQKTDITASSDTVVESGDQRSKGTKISEVRTEETTVETPHFDGGRSMNESEILGRQEVVLEAKDVISKADKTTEKVASTSDSTISETKDQESMSILCMLFENMRIWTKQEEEEVSLVETSVSETESLQVRTEDTAIEKSDLEGCRPVDESEIIGEQEQVLETEVVICDENNTPETVASSSPADDQESCAGPSSFIHMIKTILARKEPVVESEELAFHDAVEEKQRDVDSLEETAFERLHEEQEEEPELERRFVRLRFVNEYEQRSQDSLKNIGTEMKTAAEFSSEEEEATDEYQIFGEEQNEPEKLEPTAEEGTLVVSVPEEEATEEVGQTAEESMSILCMLFENMRIWTKQEEEKVSLVETSVSETESLQVRTEETAIEKSDLEGCRPVNESEELAFQDAVEEKQRDVDSLEETAFERLHEEQEEEKPELERRFVRLRFANKFERRSQDLLKNIRTEMKTAAEFSSEEEEATDEEQNESEKLEPTAEEGTLVVSFPEEEATEEVGQTAEESMSIMCMLFENMRIWTKQEEEKVSLVETSVSETESLQVRTEDTAIEKSDLESCRPVDESEIIGEQEQFLETEVVICDENNTPETVASSSPADDQESCARPSSFIHMIKTILARKEPVVESEELAFHDAVEEKQRDVDSLEETAFERLHEKQEEEPELERRFVHLRFVNEYEQRSQDSLKNTGTEMKTAAEFSSEEKEATDEYQIFGEEQNEPEKLEPTAEEGTLVVSVPEEEATEEVGQTAEESMSILCMLFENMRIWTKQEEEEVSLVETSVSETESLQVRTEETAIEKSDLEDIGSEEGTSTGFASEQDKEDKQEHKVTDKAGWTAEEEDSLDSDNAQHYFVDLGDEKSDTAALEKAFEEENRQKDSEEERQEQVIEVQVERMYQVFWLKSVIYLPDPDSVEQEERRTSTENMRAVTLVSTFPIIIHHSVTEEQMKTLMREPTEDVCLEFDSVEELE